MPQLATSGIMESTESVFRHTYAASPLRALEAALIRTLLLNPDYVRKNLLVVNTPVSLQYEKSLETMKHDWDDEERRHERRLVRFHFHRKLSSEFAVQFAPISKAEYTPHDPVISCIYWKEKDQYIVTSVDVILLLEFLVKDSFGIEEKNRIRRNLQSLRPQTISRTNKTNQRFFTLLMSLEDPRPRNIEKDLKVFQWKHLETALGKVISKYLANPATCGEVAPPVAHKRSTSHQTPSTGALASDRVLAAVGGGISKKHPHTLTDTSSPATLSHTAPMNNMAELALATSSFVPYERLKVMRRKFDQLNNHHQLLIRHKLENSKGVLEQPLPQKPLLPHKKAHPAALTLEKNGPTVPQAQRHEPNVKNDDFATPYSGTTPEDSGSGTGGGGADLNLDVSSKSGSAGDSDDLPPGESEGTGSGSSDLSKGYDSSTALSNIFSGADSLKQESSNTSGGNSVGTFSGKRKATGSGDQQAENTEGDNRQNVSAFTEDQHNRVFHGSLFKAAPSEAQRTYFQYPAKSQLYHPHIANLANKRLQPLSMLNMKKHDKEQEDKVELPPLSVSVNEQSVSDRKNEPVKGSVSGPYTLPPIVLPEKQTFPLPMPSQANGYSRSTKGNKELFAYPAEHVATTDPHTHHHDQS